MQDEKAKLAENLTKMSKHYTTVSSDLKTCKEQVAITQFKHGERMPSARQPTSEKNSVNGK